MNLEQNVDSLGLSRVEESYSLSAQSLLCAVWTCVLGGQEELFSHF